jgi:aryl-alcohol dehydrogenase-like predicted oxidoreductase
MEKRDLGNTQIAVSELCLGGNVFGWTADEATSFRILDNFMDSGGNFVDTADVYTKWVEGHRGGESETLIGKWLKRFGRRDQVIVTTKVGMDMGGDRKGLSTAHIERSIDESLRRLQTDYVDVYLSHTDDANTLLEETLRAYAKLIQQGKVRIVGASNYSADRLAEALRISEEMRLPRYEVLQPLYNLADREFETQLQPLCDEKNVSVTPYYALAAGFLTGKYRSEANLEGKARGNTVKKYLNDRGFRILAALDEVAKRHGVTPTQIAIAWLLTRRTVAAAIASATNLNQLRDLIAATELRLELADVELLTHASAVEAATSA